MTIFMENGQWFIGQWFLVSFDSANKQDHIKKPLHWANQPQWWTLEQMKMQWGNG